MKLIIDWNTFEETVKGYIKQTITISELYAKSSTEEEYEALKAEIRKFQTNVISYFEDAFEGVDPSYIQEIRYPASNRFSVGGKKDLRQLFTEKLEDLTNLRKTLEYYLRLLRISDIIVRRDEIDLERRKNFSTDEISELLLEKLFVLYDNSYHPVTSILVGNGIELKRYGEDREIMKYLEECGWVDLLHTRSVNARLTLKGKRYVENHLRKEVTDYNKINSSQEELNQKIDSIIETLKIHNVGQEVLFEELQELKELYSKLGKKNWGQILKGKLIDLGIAQVINREVMEAIFKELTHQVLLIK